MVRFIDISNWQGGIDLPALLPNLDGVVCKATEGSTFVDPYCDGWVQQCINAGKSWGFYHSQEAAARARKRHSLSATAKGISAMEYLSSIGKETKASDG